MASFFLCYAREDLDRVLILKGLLEGRKHEGWIDLEDIPPASRFRDEVKSAIASRDAFLFALSPDSLRSPECLLELTHALTYKKRLIPFVVRDLPEGVSRLPGTEALWETDWVFFLDPDRKPAIDRLDRAMTLDFEHLHRHTRFLVRALEWERNPRDGGLLLRGKILREGEAWLAGADHADPPPTELHRRFLRASQRGRGQRRRLAAILAAAVLTAGAFGIREWQRQSDIAKSRSLAAESRSTGSIVKAFRSALAADDVARTGESSAALFAALERSPSLRRVLGETSGEIEALAFHPRRPLLAAAGEGGKIYFWNTQTWALERVQEHAAEDRISQLAFSSDGSLLLSGGWDGVVRIWNVDAGGPPVSLGHSGLGLVESMALHPGGRFLVVGYSQGGSLWDLRESPPVSSPLPLSERRLNAAAFDPGGDSLALLEGTEIIHVWDFADGRLERGRQIALEAVNAVVFSSSADLVVGLGGGEVIALTAATLDEKDRFTTSNGVLALASSSDGTLISAGGNEHSAGAGGLVDVRRIDESARTHPVGGRILALAFEPGSHRLVGAGGEGILRVWDVDLVEPLARRLAVSGSAIRDLSFTADGARVVAGTLDGELSIIDAGESPATTILEETGAVEEINAIAVSGARLFWADGIGHIGRWSLADGRASQPWVRPAQVTALAAASNGSIVAAGDEHGEVVWWNTERDTPPTPLDTTAAGGETLGRVLRLRLSRRGDMLAAADSSGRVQIWRIPSGAKLAEWNFHWTAIDLDFSPDDRNLVVADYDGGELGVVSPMRPADLRTLAASCPQVSSIAFRHDGGMLLAGCKDGSVEMFAADGWAAVGKMSLGESEVGTLSASPTAGLVAAGTTAGEVILLDVDEASWARRACRIIDAQALSERPTLQPLEAHICTRLLQGAPPEPPGLRREGGRPQRRVLDLPIA